MPNAFSRLSLRFLDRLLPNVNVVPSRFWFPLGLPCLQVDPMGSRKKGYVVLYSGDLFPTEPRKPPSCPRTYSVNRKGKPTHPSAHLVDWCGFTKRWWGRSILPAIFLAWPRSLMSPESHRVLTEKTSFAIHAFIFLWPDIFSLFPFQIVLWTFYQYEAIVTRYTRLVIRVIKRSNHYAYLGGH